MKKLLKNTFLNMLCDSSIHPISLYIAIKGIKHKNLCEELKISSQYLSDICSYRRIPGRKLAKRVEEKTGIPASELVFPELREDLNDSQK